MFGSNTWDTKMCGRSLFAVKQGMEQGKGRKRRLMQKRQEEARPLVCTHGLSSRRVRMRGVLFAYKAEGDGARKRESSIYFRLPVPSRSGMIYTERVPRLRAAGEFSLSAPHPAVSSGWRSVPLPSLSLPPSLSLSVSFSFPTLARGPRCVFLG